MTDEPLAEHKLNQGLL